MINRTHKRPKENKGVRPMALNLGVCAAAARPSAPAHLGDRRLMRLSAAAAPSSSRPMELITDIRNICFAIKKVDWRKDVVL